MLTYDVSLAGQAAIPIGVQTDNEATVIAFDAADWVAKWGSNIVFSVWATRPGEDKAYEVKKILCLSNGTISWTPTAADTYKAGRGTVEIRAEDNNGVIKASGKFVTIIEPSSLANTRTPPAMPVTQYDMVQKQLETETAPPIIETKQGLGFVFAEGAAGRRLPSIRIYGRTQQSADPTPDAPVDLVHVGASRGEITVAVEDDRATAYVDGGLAGLPVDSEDAGNFVDSNGQRWICDEIDFGRGVRIQRVARVICGADNTEYWTGGVWRITTPLPGSTAGLMSTHYKAKGADAETNGRVYVDFTGKVAMENDKYTSAEVMREDLAANPVTVLFALATPIETPLDDITMEEYAKFRTVGGAQTTVVMNSAAAEMEVDYVADTKRYVDNVKPKQERYELIEEITLDGLTSVARSQTPDGVAYALSDIIIEYSISAQAESAGHTYTTVYSGDVMLCSYGIGNAIAASSERYSSVGVNIANGAAVTFATDPGMSPNSLTSLKRKPETAIGVGNITSVSISTNITYPAGSKVTIKAVKA